MPYFMLEDFAAGIDVRKAAMTAKPGSLRTLDNAFVNAGGEIEKRRKFTLLGTTSANTFGLTGIDNSCYVFGLDAPGAVTLAPGLTYQRLIPNPALPGGVTLIRILDAEVFQRKLYVIARFSDNTIRHFYDGAEVVGATGTTGRSHKSKLYKADGQILRFSAINDPANLTGTGSGFIDVTTQDAGSADLVGLEPYYNHLALLGRRSIQIWVMDPDPALNQLDEVLANIGLIAPNAVSRYGNGDVLFLADTGIRSLRARDSSNAAILNDIGSPIDPIVMERRIGIGESQAERIRAVVDPRSGHFWLVWDDVIFVLALYPATRVTAWSIYKPGFICDYATVAGGRVAIRDTENRIFVLGGVTDPAKAFDNYSPGATLAAEYDTTPVTVETPFVDLSRPATFKNFLGIDIACEGVWSIYANSDVDAPGVYEHIANVNNSTYGIAKIPYHSHSPHLQLKLTSTDARQAKVGAIAVHYQEAEQG